MHFNCSLYCTVNVVHDQLMYCTRLGTEISDFVISDMKEKKQLISLNRKIFWEFSNMTLDAVLK